MVITFCVLFLYQTVSLHAFTIANETNLRTQLFNASRYNANVRPEQMLTVQIMFNLLTVNELSIKDQSFEVSGWLTMIWEDGRLRWNEDEYGRVKFIFASQSELWRPALVISNAVKQFEVIEDEYTPLRISNNGRITWEPPGIYKVSCTPDITYYPFDTQTCHLTIQSWGYSLLELNVSALDLGINLMEFQENGEWDLIDNETKVDQSTDAKNDEYGQLLFCFKLRRKSQYYWLNMLLPVIVNSVLTALVFALPAESGEKMGYSLTTLLSFAVLLTLISDKIPSTSTSTSIVVVYFSVVLILGAMAVIFSTMVLGFHFRENDEPIPFCLRFLFRNILGRLVCYKKCTERSNVVPYELSENQPTDKQPVGSTIKRDMYLKREQTQLKLKSSSWVEPEDDFDWKDISKVFDTFMLRLYILIITTSTAGFLAGGSLGG
ncbi:neuronal acetylcholine receptor subunit alpha-3 [Patella vulgata]|uniref:neuronal acetylcholine receptor subunit alpha-3 n=1 Tax=Patella vulgata TaxID=6465 RepID=UPI0021805B39|nr:neuronal acetylcholine receptor subunit alpha-3 [Patella vulgata]